MMQLPRPALHAWPASQSAWQRDWGMPSPLSGKKRHSASAPQEAGSSTQAAPSAVPPVFRQKADFEVWVTPAVSGACAVHVNPAGQSVPNGAQVAAQVPDAGATSTHDVFGAVQSASFVQGPFAGASAAASPLEPLVPLEPLEPLEPLLPLVPLVPLVPLLPLLPLLPLDPSPGLGSELHAITRRPPPTTTPPSQPRERGPRERIRPA